MVDLDNICKPRSILQLVGSSSKESAQQIIDWIHVPASPGTGKCLVLSGRAGVGRNTTAEVVCKESGRILKKFTASANETAVSLSNWILQLRKDFVLENPKKNVDCLVILVDKCDVVPIHEFEQLHESILGNQFPMLMFIVGKERASDVIHALPSSFHVPLVSPSLHSIKHYLEAVSLMDGRYPKVEIDLAFVDRYGRNIGRMIANISNWTKRRAKTLVICYTGNGQAIQNAVKDWHAIGGQLQKNFNKDVSLMLKEDDMGTNPRIEEAKAHKIPVVTTKELAYYIQTIKNLQQNAPVAKEWEKALNEIFARHKLIDSNHEYWYPRNKPDGRHAVMIIAPSYGLDPYDDIYSNIVGFDSNLDNIFKSNRVEKENITYICTPEVHLFDCITPKVSLIGVRDPTKEVLITCLKSFFQSYAQYKYLIYFGDATDERWKLRKDDSLVSGTEVAQILRSTSVPRIAGSNLLVYPGCCLTDWDKFKFTNDNISQIMLPYFEFIPTWRKELGPITRFFQLLVYIDTDELPVKGTLKWDVKY